jgi:hypothetical protein
MIDVSIESREPNRSSAGDSGHLSGSALCFILQCILYMPELSFPPALHYAKTRHFPKKKYRYVALKISRIFSLKQLCVIFITCFLSV